MVACPDCATSNLVRAWAFDARFWTNLAALALPLLVLATIGSLLHGIDAPRRKPRARDPEANG